MVEHTPWVGDDYRSGIERQKIAIVGHSHWLGHPRDFDDLTVDIVSMVMSGEWQIRFFTAIRSYFGYQKHTDFWPRVLFFNYLPECIGNEEARYNCGTPELIERAQARFLRLLRTYLPDKVLVFTNAPGKGWQTFPETCEEKASPSKQCTRLGEQYPAAFTWGTYEVADHKVKAFGLRHPQGANGKIMRDAVRKILAVQ